MKPWKLESSCSRSALSWFDVAVPAGAFATERLVMWIVALGGRLEVACEEAMLPTDEVIFVL